MAIRCRHERLSLDPGDPGKSPPENPLTQASSLYRIPVRYTELISSRSRRVVLGVSGRSLTGVIHMGRQSKKVYKVPAISRALDVLEFLGANQTVPFTEIHSRLGFPKSSTFQLLSTLESRGYVRRSGGGSRYELGLRLFELGNLAVSRLNIRRESLPILRELASTTNQTVHIGILDGTEGVYLAKVESSRPIRLHSWEGKRIPLHSSSMGKVLLAWKSVEQLSEILAHAELPKNTLRTITDREELKAHLHMVRARGWALDDQENEPDIRCLGAPVFDIEGNVIAAVSISGLVTQASDDAIPGMLALLLEAARRISARLGNRSGTEAAGFGQGGASQQAV